MLSLVGYLDGVLFGALPYVAMFTFFLVTIQRYRGQAFTYSSLSSQFLENRQHFWGLVPFHYGILVVLTGHLIAFLIPREILLWNSRPARLYVLDAQDGRCLGRSAFGSPITAPPVPVKQGVCVGTYGGWLSYFAPE